MVGLAGPVAAQSNYRIQPGDTLQIEVLEDANLNRSVLVLPDGSISFPLAGSARAGGQSVDEVAHVLASKMATNFAAKPTVLVSVAALGQKKGRIKAAPNLMNVYILGEAAEPGRKEVLPGTTILQFLAEAGGLSRFAAEKRIQLHRIDPASGREKVYPFNFRTMGGSGSISGTTRLAPGDVIVVPERHLFE
jgi:polysaccharide export outer membrane protein